MAVEVDGGAVRGVLGRGAGEAGPPALVSWGPAVTRVICRVHGRQIASVEHRRGRRFYRSKLPLPTEWWNNNLATKRGKRVREMMMQVFVDVDSPEAERHAVSGEDHVGFLPAWCRDCQLAYWIPVVELRNGGGKLYVPLDAMLG